MVFTLPLWVYEPCLAARKSSGKAVTSIADRETLCKRLGNFARGNLHKGQCDFDVACVHRQARQSPTDFEQLLLALQLWPEEACQPVQKETHPEQRRRGRAQLPERCRQLKYDEKRIFEPLCKFKKASRHADVEFLFANSETEFKRLYWLGMSWVMVRCDFGVKSKQREDELVRRKIIWYLRTVNNVLMRHRELQTNQARLNLKRLLTAIAKECPELGFEPSMVLFAASILELFGHEQIRSSWYVFMRAYKVLRLSEYFGEGENPLGKKTALRKDAEKVWEALQNMFPVVSASFSKLGCEGLFFEVAEDLLSSVLMCGYNENMSGRLEAYFRLAEAVLYAQAPADDPREQLRNGVFCVFARRWKMFEAAETREDLTKLVKSFEDGVLIDDITLQIFDAKLCDSCTKPRIAALPLTAGFGAYTLNAVCTTGSFLGIDATHLSGILPVGACVVGSAACAVGASYAIMFGEMLASMVSIEKTRALAEASV